MSIELYISSLLIEIIEKIDTKSTKKPLIQKEREEEETYEDDGLTYMERKIKKMQKAFVKSFGTSLGGMKKSYSRIERRQLELKRQKDEREEQSLNPKENYVVYKKDDKGLIPQISQRNENCFLNKKRESQTPIVDIHGYTPIKKNRVNHPIEEYEDFGMLMSKAIKGKPKIQINKENYYEALQKQKEAEMNNSKALSSIKELEQVIKLE